MSDFNETVDKIMDSFKDEKKNRWSGKTPDGDVWVAGLLPSKKMLLVILYDSMTKKEKTVRIKEDEKEKLISMFKEMYGNDDRKTNKEDLNEANENLNNVIRYDDDSDDYRDDIIDKFKKLKIWLKDKFGNKNYEDIYNIVAELRKRCDLNFAGNEFSASRGTSFNGGDNMSLTGQTQTHLDMKWYQTYNSLIDNNIPWYVVEYALPWSLETYKKIASSILNNKNNIGRVDNKNTELRNIKNTIKLPDGSVANEDSIKARAFVKQVQDLSTAYKRLEELKLKQNSSNQINEDTVYDHSWYEVKGGKYPKRTKQGVKGLPIKESKNENNDEIERIHNEYLENKLNAFQAIEDLYIYTNFSTKEIDEILYKWSEEKEKIKSDKEEKELNDIWDDEELNETASCGATCAGSVSPVSIPMGKIAKRKRKKISEDVDSILFKESILNDMPCESEINNHKFKYFMNEGKWYMGVDNCLVKTFDKDVMMETFDQIVDELPVSVSLLEDYSCYEMDLLMEEENTMTNPTDADSDLTNNPMNATSNDEAPADNAVDSMSEDEFIANAGNKLDLLDKDDETIKSDAEIADEETHNSEILSSENQEGIIQTKDGGSIDITIGKTETIKDKNGEDMDITYYKDNTGKDMITKTKNISKKEF